MQWSAMSYALMMKRTTSVNPAKVESEDLEPSLNFILEPFLNLVITLLPPRQYGSDFMSFSQGDLLLGCALGVLCLPLARGLESR